jgi:hypothetical protein
LFVLLAAIVIGGLAAGDWIAWSGTTICCLAIASQTISLIVGRGRLRAEAVGFLVPSMTYLLTIFFVLGSELGQYGGVLPHTQLVQRWINDEHQQRPDRYSPLQMQEQEQDVKSKLSLVHFIFAVLVGYAGARYAGRVYGGSRVCAANNGEPSVATEDASKRN